MATDLEETLLAALKETLRCLENWMEIADEEDRRDYDYEAVRNAKQAVAMAESLPYDADLMRNWFGQICNPQDWRAPISALVSAEKLGITVAAIRFMTATEPEVTCICNDSYRVESIGYRMGPAGDH